MPKLRNCRFKAIWALGLGAKISGGGLELGVKFGVPKIRVKLRVGSEVRVQFGVWLRVVA